MDDIEELDLGDDPREERYNNKELNTFEGGIFHGDCQESKEIMLKNVNERLTKDAIHRILSRFGDVIRLNIPQNQETFKSYKPGFRFVWATFSLFSEAEKAVRELNCEEGNGLDIVATFSYPKAKNIEKPISTAEEALMLAREPQPMEPFPEDVFGDDYKADSFHPPIAVQFNFPVDDVYERVTEFERKKPLITYQQSKFIEFLKKKAQSSKGDVKDSLIYNQTLLDSIKTQQCSECDKVALLRCSKTGFYFCSLTCNRLMMEPTEMRAPLAKNEIIFDEAIKNGDRVLITGIINEKCLYVRRANVDFGPLLSDILETSKNSKSLEGYPKVNDLVLINFLDEKNRAVVIDVSKENDSVTVRLIDYGNTAKVGLKDLMQMELKCQNLKCFTHKVCLKAVNVDAINDQMIKLLDELLTTKSVLVANESDGQEVELSVESTNANINKTIMDFAQVPIATYNDIGVSSYFDPVPIPLGRNKKVFVVNSKPNIERPDQIAVVSESDLKDFLELYRAINVYGNSQKSSEEYGLPLELNTVFLAFCNKQWHRACLGMQERDGFPLCILIDLESWQKISVKNLIPMPNVFENPPPLVRICKIGGFNEKSNDEVKDIVAEVVKENELLTVDEIIEDEKEDIILHIEEITQSTNSSSSNESRGY